MSRDKSLLRALRDAMRQAASNLENLKLVRADEDPKIERLMRELRSLSSEEESDREIANAE